jgi:hypothetical protein
MKKSLRPALALQRSKTIRPYLKGRKALSVVSCRLHAWVHLNLLINNYVLQQATQARALACMHDPGHAMCNCNHLHTSVAEHV